MPPPPAQTTTTPPRSRSSTGRRTKTLRGSGEATTRRWPPAAAVRLQAWRCASSRARLSGKTGPIGLLGSANAGSAGSTSTRVSSVATDRSGRRLASARSIE
jgi:hypothetical protein